MLRQVGTIKYLYTSCNNQILCSYDLDLDTRLAEETTVLVETYTVPPCKPTLWMAALLTQSCSYLTDGSLRSAKSGSRHQSACSNHISSTLTNLVLPVSNLVLVFRRDAERHLTQRYSSPPFSPLRWTPERNCTNTSSSLVVQACTPDCPLVLKRR